MDKRELLKMALRGITLNGMTLDGAPTELDQENRDFVRALAAAPTDLTIRDTDTPEQKQAKTDTYALLKDALAGDRKAQRSLNAIRLVTTDNFVKARSTFMSFFDVVTLNDNEQPYVQNTTSNEIKIGYLAQDGVPRSMKIPINISETPIPLRRLSSRRVGYHTQDIYKGNISNVSQKTFDIAFDLAFRMNKECYTLLTQTVGNGGAYGTFTLTGAKPGRVYVPHSGINTANFPATNDITVKRRRTNSAGQVEWLDAANEPVGSEAAAVVSGFFGVAVLQDIIRYADSWGDIFPEGALRPTGEILVPSGDIFDILFALAPANQTNMNETQIQREVTERGYTSFNYAGINWKFIPDVTLPTGTAYPKFNKTPGSVFLKPGLDAEFTHTDNEQHYEERSQQKVFGAYVMNQRRINVARFTYK